MVPRLYDYMLIRSRLDKAGIVQGFLFIHFLWLYSRNVLYRKPYLIHYSLALPSVDIAQNFRWLDYQTGNKCRAPSI
jgi:hypothetical protein